MVSETGEADGGFPHDREPASRVDVDTHVLTMPGPMLRRGFWLYVWRIEAPSGEMLYVGRTGDNSSPHATAPYTRMGQHLGSVVTQNALRKHLDRRGVDLHACTFHLVSHGPLFPEIVKEPSDDRASLMIRHLPVRNIVGAMEKALADDLRTAGYAVLNTVKWRHPLDQQAWAPVRAAFAQHFPNLSPNGPRQGGSPLESARGGGGL